MRRIKGVMAVVPTPLTSNEDADIDGIERLIDFLAGHGLSLFALGSAGEGMNLTFKTRVAVARKMAEVNDGRVPLLVGGGGFSVRDSLEFVDAVADCRIDGIHVIPYDKKISGAAVELLYRGIADRSPLPIWLYQNTTRTSGIPIEVVKSLSSHPNIHGVKLAGFDLRVNQGFMDLDSPDFQVFGSADTQMFSFFCHGLEGSSSSAAACFPELFKELYEAIQSDSLSRARAKNREVMTFLKRLPKGAYWHNGESAAEVKYQLSLRGICGEQVARPWRGQTDEEKRISEVVHRDYQHYLQTGELRLA
jgi:dihydrodipicolinate synthase/N-acetylneuraminate lyase